MRKFRLIALAFVALLTLGVGGSALAHGPSGSGEHHTDPETGEEVHTNQVECDEGEATPVGTVYVAEDGIEVCNDGSSDVTVVQGRVIVAEDGEGGGYIAADGDQDNEAPLDGYARINSDGSIQCSDEDDTSAPHAGTPGDGSTCG